MKAKLSLAALTGLAIGVVAMWLLVARTTDQAFSDLYVSSVADQANVALHIRAGRQMELVKSIEAALPSYVLALDQDFGGHPGSTEALWMVKAYYERNQITISSEVRQILDALPPKPPTSCLIRLRALDQAPPANATDSGFAK